MKRKTKSWEKVCEPFTLVFVIIIFTCLYISAISYGYAVQQNELRTIKAKYEGLLSQDNISLFKPSLKEILDFLQQDDTDKHEFIKDIYDCEYFTKDLIKNATKKGIKAYSVIIKWELSYTGHNIVGFETEEGMIFVEPQNDKLLEVYPGAVINQRTVSDYHVCRP